MKGKWFLWFGKSLRPYFSFILIIRIPLGFQMRIILMISSATYQNFYMQNQSFVCWKYHKLIILSTSNSSSSFLLYKLLIILDFLFPFWGDFSWNLELQNRLYLSRFSEYYLKMIFFALILRINLFSLWYRLIEYDDVEVIVKCLRKYLHHLPFE